MNSFPIVFPYLVMQTLNQALLSDKAKTLTDFLVHMIPIVKSIFVCKIPLGTQNLMQMPYFAAG